LKSPSTSTCFRGSAPARPRPSPRRRCGMWSERAALLPRPGACVPGRLPADASRLSSMNECCLCGAGVWGAQGSRDARVESRGGAANGACHHRAPPRRRGAGGRLQSMPAVCGWHRIARGTARRCRGAVPIKPELYSHLHTSAVALAAGPCWLDAPPPKRAVRRGARGQHAPLTASARGARRGCRPCRPAGTVRAVGYSEKRSYLK
jgi:hypothetical protein